MINKKGSTLFLAMVVMGIVLVLGIGVATILVKQIREIRDIEEEKLSFYIQEMAIDEITYGEINLDEWVFMQWKEDGKIIKYIVTEEEGEKVVTVEIDGKYYLFEDGVMQEGNGNGNGDDNGTTEPEDDALFVYYDNPNEWSDVTMRYQVEFNDESLAVFKSEMSNSPTYSGWKINEIDTSEISALRTFFCDGKEDEVASNCNDDGMYGWWNTTGMYATVCVEDSTDKPCNSPNTIFVYYNNPNEWIDVTMRYQINSTSGSVLRDTMSNSPTYSGWKINEIDTSEISALRTFFCDGKEDEVGNCQDDGMYPGGSSFFEVSNTRMVCVESDGGEEISEDNSFSCFSPEVPF